VKFSVSDSVATPQAALNLTFSEGKNKMQFHENIFELEAMYKTKRNCNSEKTMQLIRVLHQLGGKHQLRRH